MARRMTRRMTRRATRSCPGGCLYSGRLLLRAPVPPARPCRLRDLLCSILSRPVALISAAFRCGCSKRRLPRNRSFVPPLKRRPGVSCPPKPAPGTGSKRFGETNAFRACPRPSLRQHRTLCAAGKGFRRSPRFFAPKRAVFLLTRPLALPAPGPGPRRACRAVHPRIFKKLLGISVPLS